MAEALDGHVEAGVEVAFLTGATYPIEALPGALPEIVPWAIPFTSSIKAIRGIILDGTSITAYGAEVLIGIGWLLVAFALATKGYKLNRET